MWFPNACLLAHKKAPCLFIVPFFFIVPFQSNSFLFSPIHLLKSSGSEWHVEVLKKGINEVKAAVKAARKSESEKKKRKKDDGVNTAVDASTVGPGELWFKGIAEHQKNTWDLESLKWEEFAQKHVDMPGVCTLGSEKNVLDANGPLMSLISFFTAEYSSHPFRLSRGRAYKSMQPEDDSVKEARGVPSGTCPWGFELRV